MKNEDLLAEFRCRGACEMCGRRVYPLQPDHYRCRGMGGGSRLDIRINLAALCPPCHTEYQEAPREKRRRVLEVIAKRERTTPEDIEAVVAVILRTPKGGVVNGSGLSAAQAKLLAKTMMEVSRECK